MTRARLNGVVLVLGLAATIATAAEPRKLTIVFTGDNGGEVAPCG